MSIIHGLSNIEDFEKEVTEYKKELSPNLIRASTDSIPIKHGENRILFTASAVFYVNKRPQLIRLVIICGILKTHVKTLQFAATKALDYEKQIKAFCAKNKIRFSNGVLLIENE